MAANLSEAPPLPVVTRLECETSMAHSGQKLPQTRISGQTIIDELIRNMELGRLEMGYSILLPCLFSVYLHPDDFARLAGVHGAGGVSGRLANPRTSEHRRSEDGAPPATQQPAAS